MIRDLLSFSHSFFFDGWPSFLQQFPLHGGVCILSGTLSTVALVAVLRPANAQLPERGNRRSFFGSSSFCERAALNSALFFFFLLFVACISIGVSSKIANASNRTGPNLISYEIQLQQAATGLPVNTSDGLDRNPSTGR